MNTLMDMTTSVGGWLSDELSIVSAVMSKQLKNERPAVNDVCDELATYRGKMLRPSLLLLSWKAVSRKTNTPTDVRVAAAVVELIHLATLVHDDVLDDADLRRGKRTINSLRGNEAAVMLGDYLLSSAFHLCSTIRNTSLNILLGSVTNTLCAGEIVQLSNRYNVELDVDSYFQIIHDKTGSLVAASCEMGATVGLAKEDDVSALKEFGKFIGAAFQIKDDLLDLLGKREIIGKPAGRDIEKGKLTLPIILMLNQNQSLRPRVQSAIENNDRKSLLNMLEAAGSINSSFDVVNDLVSTGIESIQHINNEEGVQLCTLAEKLKHRY
jgi:octaprenyl-diphosphate synthase